MLHPPSPPEEELGCEASSQEETAVEALVERTTTTTTTTEQTAGEGAGDNEPTLTTTTGSPPPSTEQRLPQSPSDVDEELAGASGAERPGPGTEVEDEGEGDGDHHTDRLMPLRDDGEEAVGLEAKGRGGATAASPADTTTEEVVPAGGVKADDDASADPGADNGADEQTISSTDGPHPAATRPSPSSSEDVRGAGGRPGEGVGVGEVVVGERNDGPDMTASETAKVAATDVVEAAAVPPAPDPDPDPSPPSLSPPEEYEVSIPVTAEGLLLSLSEVQVPARTSGGESSSDPTPVHVHAVGACFAGYKRFSDGRVGPAEEADMVRSEGDRIVAVDGVSVLGVSFRDVVDTIRRAVDRRLRGGRRGSRGESSTASAAHSETDDRMEKCRIRFVEAAEWERWSAEMSRWVALRDHRNQRTPPSLSEKGGGSKESKTKASANASADDNQTLSRDKSPPRRSSPAPDGAAMATTEARKAAAEEAGEYESELPVTEEGLLIKLEEWQHHGGVAGRDGDGDDGREKPGGPSGRGDEEENRGIEEGDESEGDGSGKGAVETVVEEEGGVCDGDNGEDMNRKDSERDDTGVGKCRSDDDDGDVKDGVECKVADDEDGNGKGDDEKIASGGRGISDRGDGDDGEDRTCQEMDVVDRGGENCGGADDGSIGSKDGDEVADCKDDSRQGGDKLSSGEGGDDGGDNHDGEEMHRQNVKGNDKGGVDVRSEKSSGEKDSDETRRRHSQSNGSERNRTLATASACFAGYKRFSDGRMGPSEARQLVKSLGDRIVAVENASVLGLSFDDVVDRIKVAIRVVGCSKTSSKTSPPLGGVCRIRFVEAAKWDSWSSEASRWTAQWENTSPPSEGCGRLAEASSDGTEATERFPTQKRRNPVHPVRTLGTGNACGWPVHYPTPTPPQPQQHPYAYWPQHQQHHFPIPFGQYVPMQNHWLPMMPQRYVDPICSLCSKPIQYGIPQVHFPPHVAQGLSPVHLHMTCGKVAFVRGRPDLNVVHPYAMVRKMEREWKEFFGFMAVRAADSLRELVPKVRTSLPEWHGYRTADSYCLEGELRAVTEELYVDLVWKKKYGATKTNKAGGKQAEKRKNEEEREGRDVAAEKPKESADKGENREVRAQDTRRDEGDTSCEASQCAPGVGDAVDDAGQCNNIDDKTKQKDEVEKETGEQVEETQEGIGIATRGDDAKKTGESDDGGSTKNVSLGVYFSILHGANASRSVNSGTNMVSTSPTLTLEAGRKRRCSVTNASSASSDSVNDEGGGQQSSDAESEKDEEKEIEEEAMFVLAAIEESRRSNSNTSSKHTRVSAVETSPDSQEQINGKKKKQPNKKIKDSSTFLKDSRPNTVGNSPKGQAKRIGRKQHATKTSTAQIIVIDDSDFDSYVPTSDEDDDDDYVPPSRKRVRTSSISSEVKHRRRQSAKKAAKVDRPSKEKRPAERVKKPATVDCPDEDKRSREKVKKMAKVEGPKGDKRPRKTAEPNKLPKCMVRENIETGASASQQSASVGNDGSQPVSTGATRSGKQPPPHTVSWQPVPPNRSLHGHGMQSGPFPPPWPQRCYPPYPMPSRGPSVESYYGPNPGSGGGRYWHPPPHPQAAQFDTMQSPHPTNCFQQAPHRWK